MFPKGKDTLGELGLVRPSSFQVTSTKIMHELICRLALKTYLYLHSSFFQLVQITNNISAKFRKMDRQLECTQTNK